MSTPFDEIDDPVPPSTGFVPEDDPGYDWDNWSPSSEGAGDD